MDALDLFNLISEPDYRKTLSDSIYASFRSLTFTHYALLKIFANASKKLCLGAFMDHEQPKEGETLFSNLLAKVAGYQTQIEDLSRSLFTDYLAETETAQTNGSYLPESLLALIDETIAARTQTITHPSALKTPATNYLRQLSS
jgi:antitoxin component YwqK of YwqJK toxin-antitoxin module